MPMLSAPRQTQGLDLSPRLDVEQRTSLQSDTQQSQAQRQSQSQRQRPLLQTRPAQTKRPRPPTTPRRPNRPRPRFPQNRPNRRLRRDRDLVTQRNTSPADGQRFTLRVGKKGNQYTYQRRGLGPGDVKEQVRRLVDQTPAAGFKILDSQGNPVKPQSLGIQGYKKSKNTPGYFTEPNKKRINTVTEFNALQRQNSASKKRNKRSRRGPRFPLPEDAPRFSRLRQRGRRRRGGRR